MTRVAVAMAGALCLAGCSSFSAGDFMPSLPLSGGTIPLQLDSTPPGAEARTSLGAACRTPCTVAVPVQEGLTVTFALAGYDSQTIPISLRRSTPLGSDPSSSGAVQLAPNPVLAELEPAAVAPAPVAKKKPAKPKPKTAAKTSAPTGSAPPAPRAPQPPAPEVPASQRTIPGAQPTAPPASAWPPPR
jgi:hypothetical protein